MPDRERDCTLTFQCDSVHATHAELTVRGIHFVHEPKSVAWGYGAELLDPDGYRVMIWDKDTMPGYKERKNVCSLWLKLTAAECEKQYAGTICGSL